MTGQENLVSACQAFQADICPDANHFPFTASAGMGFPKRDTVIYFNVFHRYYYKTISSVGGLFGT